MRIPLSDVPQNVQDAVVAAENRTFWTDHGIDPKGILRVAFSDAGRQRRPRAPRRSPSSTSRCSTCPSERTVTRKIKEAFLSLKIQQQMSKSADLAGHRNTIYFGRGAYGIQAAAQAYFNIDAQDLSLRQSAVLAAVLNSPGNFDPAEGDGNREALLARYRYVLNGMVTMGNLSRDAADRAGGAPAQVPEHPQPERVRRAAGARADPGPLRAARRRVLRRPDRRLRPRATTSHAQGDERGRSGRSRTRSRRA